MREILCSLWLVYSTPKKNQHNARNMYYVNYFTGIYLPPSHQVIIENTITITLQWLSMHSSLFAFFPFGYFNLIGCQGKCPVLAPSNQLVGVKGQCGPPQHLLEFMPLMPIQRQPIQHTQPVTLTLDLSSSRWGLLPESRIQLSYTFHWKKFGYYARIFFQIYLFKSSL